MSVEFRMPDIGEGIAEVELLEWNVEVGAVVREYDTLATIQTDKSIVEMPSPVTGRVTRLGVQAGDMLPVGDVLIVFDTSDDAAAEQATAAGSRATPASARTAAPAPSPADVPVVTDRPAARPKASPVVRRLALDEGVDLALVSGTGPGGRITREDVQLAATGAAQEETSGTPAAQDSKRPAAGRGGVADRDLPDEHVPLRGLRRQIAKKMAESWRSVPHITDWRETDATQLIEARRALIAHVPAAAGALTYVPFFVKITAMALQHHPLMNASFDEEAQEYVLHRRINIGIATAAPDGLLVPVVRNADTKTIIELADEISELVALARERKASREQLTGGTYTVNNFGSIGGHMGTPIIRTPEVGILGFGRIADRVVAVDGSPVVRKTIMLSSVGDHRLHDGDTLGAFTSAVADLIEHPYALLGELR